MESTFNRMQEGLPYGSTALMRVKPEENRGQDVVPVVIARKAPIPWDRSFASDGMFDLGDIMLWIHDIPQARGGYGRRFKVEPDMVNATKLRAVPLTTIAALGMPMASYMKQSSTHPSIWELMPSSIKKARSNAVLMSLEPSLAFLDLPLVPLEVPDIERAPVSETGMFPDGTLLKRSIRAPTVIVDGGHRARPAWRGTKPFQGKITGQIFNPDLRRYSYPVVWHGGTPGERALADLPDIIDEGLVELLTS